MFLKRVQSLIVCHRKWNENNRRKIDANHMLNVCVIANSKCDMM